MAFPTAGQVWELRKTPRVPEIHLWIPNTRCLAVREGIRVHGTADLPSADIVRRRDGIDVTSPPRSTFDAAASLTANDLESLIEQGIHRPYFTIPTLWGLARRLCRYSLAELAEAGGDQLVDELVGERLVDGESQRALGGFVAGQLVAQVVEH